MSRGAASRLHNNALFRVDSGVETRGFLDDSTKQVEWGEAHLLAGLHEFLSTYSKRPIKRNVLGMRLDHSFGLWFLARQLEPEIIIESGGLRGHTTWVLRQAMPDARIISISPEHPLSHLEDGLGAYVDSNCEYLTGEKFVDFGYVRWDRHLQQDADRRKILVLFDDHQNHLKRNSQEARTRNLRKKMWENAVNISDLCSRGGAWWGKQGRAYDNFGKTNAPISYEQHVKNFHLLESILDTYWELPPLAAAYLTRQTTFDPARTSWPLVFNLKDTSIFSKIGFDKWLFNAYAYMVYARLKNDIPSEFQLEIEQEWVDNLGTDPKY
ncbi:uncharacterized protein LOC9637997 [Selaginella moellendorffii]|uniref:uncharacterized protein LOC9637997 n=1 Tax=Selaginella moellendorffii TaxID=88036 RepID=UPI000D1C64DD|nr:uncharacterized protein LOC9637997 [Selaginella moellendorffii]|eukprot:XP_024523479.1 uncharacterized protein LOC9637997 [Selaginella moellendorffii]